MTKRNWFNTLGLSKHISLRGFALIFLALTQVPIAIKKTAEIACIGQTSNMIWQKENNHSQANMLAIQRGNGGK